LAGEDRQFHRTVYSQADTSLRAAIRFRKGGQGGTTIEGAKLLGVSDKTGSLTPGKRADLVTIRKSDINMAPVGDPYYAIVFFGQPSNIETVMVDGRVLVRDGKLTSIDLIKTVGEATKSVRGILERAKAG
jgi:5-methylthioadenosine/S-adenosylhomocysteine deaminase